jgi:hypothetical protein
MLPAGTGKLIVFIRRRTSRSLHERFNFIPKLYNKAEAFLCTTTRPPLPRLQREGAEAEDDVP